MKGTLVNLYVALGVTCLMHVLGCINALVKLAQVYSYIFDFIVRLTSCHVSISYQRFNQLWTKKIQNYIHYLGKMSQSPVNWQATECLKIVFLNLNSFLFLDYYYQSNFIFKFYFYKNLIFLIQKFYFKPLSGPPSQTIPSWWPVDCIKIFKKYRIKPFVHIQLNVRFMPILVFVYLELTMHSKLLK